MKSKKNNVFDYNTLKKKKDKKSFRQSIYEGIIALLKIIVKAINIGVIVLTYYIFTSQLSILVTGGSSAVLKSNTLDEVAKAGLINNYQAWMVALCVLLLLKSKFVFKKMVDVERTIYNSVKSEVSRLVAKNKG